METIEGARITIKEVEDVLKCRGFSIKHWVVSGEFNDSLSELTEIKFLDSKTGRVLGMTWSPERDTFSYTFNLDFTIHYGSRHLKEHTRSTSNIVPEIVTPRMMLSQLAKIYDPLGLISPFILEGKILMRKTLECEISNGIMKNMWDIPLACELWKGWVKFFDTLHELEKIEFKRCMKPVRAVGATK